MSVDLVQEARLDLSRPAAILWLACVMAAGPPLRVQAQPLIPNPGLTSLMQPQRLDRSRPLISEDRAAGTRSGVRQPQPPGTSACDRPGSATSGRTSTAPAGPSLYGGGAGPGDYGRYLPGGPPADTAGKKPGAPPPPGAGVTPPADRPLYGGNDRPLWASGAPRAPAAPSPSAAPGEAGKDLSSSGQPSATPAPVRDRPLWAMRGVAAVADPATSSAPAGAEAGPCTASSSPLLPR